MSDLAKKAATLPLISWSELSLGKLIGNGSYGDVYEGLYKGQVVAIKLLQQKTLSAPSEQNFREEAALMWECQAANVLELHGICIEPGHCAMVLAYMPNKSLYQYLQDPALKLTEEMRWNLALDIAKGLAALHAKNILHRDLKSFNILLGADLVAKISDFGLAKLKLESRATSTARVSSHTVGTVRWRAPELFKRGAVANMATDMYSYGMILWEILTRKMPFADAQDEPTVISWVKDGEKEIIPVDCDLVWKQIIEGCWQAEPEKRPQAAEVVSRLEASRPISKIVEPEVIGAKSWHFSPDLKPDPKKIKEGGYELINAGKQDIEKVQAFYYHHPVPGYDLAKVEIICNPVMNRSFALKLTKLQQRASQVAFAGRWKTEGTAEQQKWRAEIDEKFKAVTAAYIDADAPDVKLIPAWHGTRPEVLGSIFTAGYANLATTDAGFFGRGLYSALEAEYSYRVYSKGALIVNWVASYSAYPVIDGDMLKLAGGGNYENYDAHLVPVKPATKSITETVYHPCKPGEQPVYTEVVVFNDEQCLPRYLVTLQPNRPKEIGSAPDIMLSLLFSSGSKAALKKLEETAAPAKAVPLVKVAAPAIKPAHSVSVEEAQQFLTYVVQGRQDEAEAMLKLRPEIAVAPGTVTDHAGREFCGMTGLQVAICNLDWYMWEMMLQYIPLEVARENVQELVGSEECQRLQAAILQVWNKLIEEYQKYIDMDWDWDEAECAHQWTKVIGALQKRLPIHVLQEYCHPTRPFHPCTPEMFKAEVFPRKDVHGDGVVSAFSKLAVDFAIYRGEGNGARARREPPYCDGPCTRYMRAAWCGPCRQRGRSLADGTAIVRLLSVRAKQRDELLTRLKVKATVAKPK